MAWKRKTKKFVCEECGKDFNTERQLQNHKRDKHLIEYKFDDDSWIPQDLLVGQD